MAAGQPPYYKTPDELQTKIDDYFVYIEGEFEWVAQGEEDVKQWIRSPEPATITGLCLFLGFESRQSFHDYAKHAEFSYTIKKARLRIENSYEISLNYSKAPAAQIFALKNLGWDDKQSIDHTSAGEKIQNTPIIFTKGANEGTDTDQ